MSEGSVRVLSIEDVEADFRMLERLLAQQLPAARCVWEPRAAAAEQRLASEEWDLLLVDYHVPGLDFEALVSWCRAERPHLPVVLVSGSVGEERAVELAQAGVWGFVFKDNLARLSHVIQRSLREAAVARAQRAAEERFRLAVEASDEGVWEYDLRTEEFTVSDRWYELLGLAPGSVPATPELVLEALGAEDRRALDALQQQLLAGEAERVSQQVHLTRADGQRLALQVKATVARAADGRVLRMVGTLADVTERERYEHQLRSQALVLETIAQGVTFVDGEGRIRYTNPAFEAMFGYERDELLGRRVRELNDLPPDASDRLVEQLQSRVEAGETWVGDVPNRRRDGSRFISRAVVRPAPHLGPGYSVSVQEDCTGRLLLSRLLAELNTSADLHTLMANVTALLQQALDFEAVGVRLRQGDDYPYFETRGLDAEFVQLENSLCELDAHGRPLLDPAGQPALACVCGAVLRGQAAAGVGQLTARGSFWTNCVSSLPATDDEPDCALRRRNRCAREGFESVAMVALRAGDEVYGLLQLNDRRPNRFSAELLEVLEQLADALAVSLAQRESQQRRAESEERYRLLAEHTDNLVSMALPTGRLVYASPSHERLTGWTAEEIVSGARPPLNHPDDLPAIERARQANLRGEPSDLEYRLRCRDGRWLWLAGHCTPVLGPGGEVQQLILWSRDITERKLHEEQQAQLQAQFLRAQKLEAVGRLAAGIAHDFNNMLGVIVGYSEMLLTEVGAAHPYHHDLAQILDAARRSADLTRQLLAFSRQQPSQPRPLDLNEQILGMQRMLQRVIGDDIELVVDLRDGLWPVSADPTQIDQILANLAVNARDAMPGCGRLTIGTGHARADEAFCHVHPGTAPGDYVTFKVSDTGSGMDEETLAQVFEPFFTTKTEGRGTGLGLSTVYGIVQQHHGTIVLHSALGCGTSLEVWLPRLLTDEPPRASATVAASRRGERETVLVVEDQPEVLHLVSTMLERLNYRVLRASSLAEALALAEQPDLPVDLLLTDVVMPNVSGPALAAILQTARPGLRVLYMSGYSDSASGDGAWASLGSAPLLQKPFTLAALSHLVRECLGPDARQD